MRRKNLNYTYLKIQYVISFYYLNIWSNKSKESYSLRYKTQTPKNQKRRNTPCLFLLSDLNQSNDNIALLKLGNPGNCNRKFILCIP